MQSTIDNRKSSIAQSLLRWYARYGRDLPWRRTRNPYRILVSEIMLQQTQVRRVLEKYPQFLRRFPKFTSLARAKKSSVVRAWRGMGYNNRAIRLQQLAQIVVREFGGRLPHDVESLQQLPGIGRYTAHAIACFAFHQTVPVVDTNVRRVHARLFPSRTKRRDVWDVAAEILPVKRADNWNQALFDLGATVCSAGQPKCELCPVSKLCPSAFKTVRRQQRSSKQEPSRNGLPNRIYRGRIIEILRTLRHNQSISTDRIGKRIKENFSKRDVRWLHTMLRTLERDGLIALHSGSSTFRVSLAE